jgi:hypothetical protein
LITNALEMYSKAGTCRKLESSTIAALSIYFIEHFAVMAIIVSACVRAFTKAKHNIVWHLSYYGLAIYQF